MTAPTSDCSHKCAPGWRAAMPVIGSRAVSRPRPYPSSSTQNHLTPSPSSGACRTVRLIPLLWSKVIHGASTDIQQLWLRLARLLRYSPRCRQALRGQVDVYNPHRNRMRQLRRPPWARVQGRRVQQPHGREALREWDLAQLQGGSKVVFDGDRAGFRSYRKGKRLGGGLGIARVLLSRRKALAV